MSIIGNPLLLGGGKSNVFAFIVVTYPAGSTLTATNGTKTLTAGNTTGKWVFNIPRAGVWTITSTYLTQISTKNVTIAEEGQTEIITLSYNVPAEYQEVEWIQFTGTQYLNVSFTPNSNYAYTISGYINFGLNPPVLNVPIIASKTSAQNDAFGFFYYKSSNKFLISWGREYTTDSTVSNYLDNFHNYEIFLESGEQQLIIDGTLLCSSANTQHPTFLNSNLFKGNGSATNYEASRFYGKIKNLLVTENGIDKYKLYPCYRKSDSVAGFWNATAQTFYTNAGTGSFIVGGDV